MLQPQVSHHQQDAYRFQKSVENISLMCLTALPETILTGNNNNINDSGGAYGRFSLDPRCYAAVTTELKTHGMTQMCQSIHNIMNSSNGSVSSIPVLQLCEAWVKYMPLPIDFINATVPLVLQAWEQCRLSHQLHPQALVEAKAATSYWIVIMESASWSIDQVLVSSLVQSKNSSRQSNKKKQSSKSKKRHQQFLDENTTDELYVSASKEVIYRGRVACTIAQQTLTVLQELLIFELRRISESKILTDGGEQEFQGDGPVGAITACANACLPYLLRTSVGCQDTTSMTLFITISHLIQQVCASPSRLVRSFTAESLYTLHETLVKTLTENCNIPFTTEFLEAVINHFFLCSINLVFQCGYPPGFFEDLNQDNDEEIEGERTDVRDILRSISSIPSTTNERNGGLSAPLTFTTSSILLRLMQACAQPIRDARASNSLFSESVLHAFSALTKPINSAAILYAKNVCLSICKTNVDLILNLAFEIASNAGMCLLLAFPIAPVNEILPLSRLYNLAIASLAPTFSTLCQIESMKQEVERVIRIGIDAAATSLARLPELTGPSTLRQTRFDIRGAMRSPGGEDHVGVLGLMRLANESGPLSLVFLKCKESILVDLCELHEVLKKMENQRGKGVFYGIGVLPKSRRILLGVICDLEVLSDDKDHTSRILTSIFENAVASIASTNHQLDNLSAEILSKICECAFDIAAFSPHVIHSFFNVSNSVTLRTICLHVLHQAGNFGFLLSDDASTECGTIFEWNRLRAALFTLLKMAGDPDLPDSIVEILISFITKECEAATIQCSAGPTSSSKIFHEDVISEESIPPGLFIRVVTETLDKAFLMQIPIFQMRNALQVLYKTRHSIIRTLLSPCPMPIQKGSFHDPRPVIAETWFLCMDRIATITTNQGAIDDHEAIGSEIASVRKQLLVETFVSAISLLLHTSLGKTQEERGNDPGMSLDGPQGLVIMDFLVNFFSLGMSMIQVGARELISLVPVNIENNADEAGIGIIGAALFRGSQGGLPPWAVESVPSVYSSLFKALGKNVDNFGHMFEISMNIRLLHNKSFGSVEGGSLLSGRFFEKMNGKAKLSFINQAKEHAKNNTTASWRRLKTLIKQACGGKKKDTDFKQRPALTSWCSLDRV